MGIFTDFLNSKHPQKLTSPTSPNADYLSICAIMRNEAPYLKEWIEYHKIVGVERFYLFDNESTDNTKDVLQPYIDAGLVIYTYAPGDKKNGFQSQAYNRCIQEHKDDTWWLAIIDIDEFLVPMKDDKISDFLKKCEPYPGIVINWLMFDSNGHINKPQGGVLENYTRIHYQRDHHDNIVTKCIVNPREISSAGGHFHFYKNEQVHVNELFQPLPPILPEYVSARHLENHIRINHYWTKSYEEFSIKAKRPRCNGQELKIREEYWNYPDYKYDYSIWKFVAQMPGHNRQEEYQRFLDCQQKNIKIELHHPHLLSLDDFIDEKWYFKKYPEAKNIGCSALDHYHFYGWKKGYNPSKKFDTSFYLNKYPDIKNAGIDPLYHYVFFGHNEGREPKSSTQKADYNTIKKSTLFDEKWYLKQYPDVKNANLNPIKHYLHFGWRENRNPGPLFNTKFYLTTYPDVQKNNICPLLHYEKFGKNEGRTINKQSINLPLLKKTHSSFLSKILFWFQRPIKFSIVVASYNYASYITQTLNSLLAQTYKNYEIIVVDDGSKDNSVKIIKKYAQKYKNIFLYQHPKKNNKGLSKTLQLGISKATGDFICFCESDDYWRSDHLEQIFHLITDFPKAKIISNNVELFEDVNQEILKHMQTIYNLLKSNVNYLNILELPINPIATFSAVCIKKDILKNCNFNSFIIPAWLDWWLWRQILINTPLYYIPEKITFFRIHNSYNSKEKNAVYMHKIKKFLHQSNQLIITKIGYASLYRKYQKDKKIYQNEDINIIEASKYFDEDYYLKNYPESLFSANAAKHYLETGWKKGYNPSSHFSTEKYLRFYADIQNANINPLLHYEKYGKIEKRMTFDIQEKHMTYFADNSNKTSKKTIMLVTHILNYTGAPMLLLSIAKVFQKMKYKVILLSPEDGELKDEFLKNGISVIIDADAYTNEYAYKKYQKMGINFCLFNTYLTYLPYSFFAPHIPSILWIHDNLLPNQVHSQLKATLKNSNDIYVPSELTKTYIEKYATSTKILSYPIEDRVGSTFKAKQVPQTLKIAIIATIQPRKGHDIAVQAIKALPQDIRQQASFTFIGEEISSQYFQSLKNETEEIKEISFRPTIKERDKYYQLYNEFDILLCPSREDPYPLVVIDALMYGCPVICSDHVGQKDIIERTQSGFVFSSENSGELANLLIEIITHKDNLPVLSKSARQAYLNYFDFETCADNLKKIVEGKCKK